MKKKFVFLIVLILLLFVSKYIAMDYPVSSGKRVGNLTKISKKGSFIFKTWEGTIDEGSGDKLTTHFSVRSNELGRELYGYEGREVILYYEQYYWGFPRDTNYNIISWKAKGSSEKTGPIQQAVEAQKEGMALLGRTLFCGLLGALRKNEELYFQVKNYIKDDNLYLYNQFKKCNE